MILQIDKEFQELIPPLSQDEYKELEESLKSYGYDSARGKIITWNGIIIDGHNRYEICTKHNIKFETEDKSFADRADVKIWIIRNQLGRRNIPDFVRIELALALKDEIAKKAKLNLSTSTGGANPQPLVILPKAEKSPINTREEIATMAGVSGKTVDKAEKILKQAPKHIKDKARSGEMKVHTAYKEMQKELKETKVCSVCGEEKPLVEFKIRSDNGTRRGACKKCENEKERLRKGGDTESESMSQLLKEFKSEAEKLGISSFILAGVSALSSAVKQVKDDLEKHLEEVQEESERDDIKQRLQQEVDEISKLIKLF